MRIAFDLDGTIITCEPRQSAALLAVTRSIPCDVDAAMVWELKRNGATTLGALVACGISESIARYVARRWRDIIEDWCWLQIDRPYVDAYECLDRLRSAGMAVACITARSRPEFVPLQLQSLRLLKCFDDIYVVSPSQRVDGKAAILSEGGFACFVGDTESDQNAAKLAGVAPLLVNTGQRSGAFLSNRCQSPVHGSLAEVLDAFL